LKEFVNCSLTLGTSISALFGECAALTSTAGITFIKKPSTSIGSLYSVFKDCGKLERIYADKNSKSPGNEDDITIFIQTFADNTTSDFNYAFRSCSSFKKS
jgi:hypothetical protein